MNNIYAQSIYYCLPLILTKKKMLSMDFSLYTLYIYNVMYVVEYVKKKTV